jgi:outer membrane protein TolC
MLTLVLAGAGASCSTQAQTVPSASPLASPTPAVSAPSPIDTARPISLNEAIDLAIKQTSTYTTAQINQQIAAEDVRQARAAFLPKVTAPLTYIFTSPSLAETSPRPPSFIAANAVNEYQALVTAAGEIDTSGRLRAELRRTQALVESARAGGEVARRELIQSVVDAYYNFALAITKRRGAEANLRSAIEFEQNTKLQLEAGEVAPVDLVRARLQTAARRDELAQATTDEQVNSIALKALIGAGFTDQIATVDLLTQMPAPDEIQQYTEAMIATRPEFAQYEADRRAAEQEINVARAERRPQITYSLSPGFDTDSMRPMSLKNHAGVQASIGVSVPIFDWGASRSREAQARLRMQLAENTRQLSQRQFVQAFYTARVQALAAQERIVQLNATIADAESDLAASLARYRAGEATIAEVIDAENLLITERQALYQALFDYQTAKSRLARAAGK